MFAASRSRPVDVSRKVTPQSLLKRYWRLRWEWLGCTLLVFVFIFALQSSQVLKRFDLAVYDLLLKYEAPPTPQDIVIIAIDETSLAALGQWPWPRDYHAAMLSQLAVAKPKAVAMSLLFLEPGTQSRSDHALAEALRLPGLGKVFLPITAAPQAATGAPQWQKPIPLLADAASGFGHVNIDMGDDGVVRSMQLFPQAQQNQPPSLPYQLFKAAHPDGVPQHSWHRLLPGDGWLLPFSSAPGHFRTVPFISVLRGEVPTSVLADKLVLVGVTAKGLGDQYPTPLSARSSLMPGVEIAATALEGLLERRLIAPVSPGAALWAQLALALFWMVFLYFLGPRSSAVVLGMGMAGLLYFSGISLGKAHVWWPIVDLLSGLLFGYLLWGWRRLTILFADLSLRTQALLEGSTKPIVESSASRPKNHNEWGKILTSLDAGLHIAELNRKRVSDTLQALPEAVLLINADGLVEMANERAHHLLKMQRVIDLTALSLIVTTFDAELNDVSSWQALMDLVAAQQGAGLEVQLSADLFVLIRTTAIQSLASIDSSGGGKSWWIVILIDISKQKKFQRQQNDALQLLWHDLRAPQSAILSLLGMHDEQEDASPRRWIELKNRIATQVHTTLGMVDDFVWQLRAEADTYEYREVDVVQLVGEVVDRVWPLAMEKKIDLSCDFSQLPPCVSDALQGAGGADDATSSDPPCLWLQVDPSLMGRAIFNLVENAIKYSPSHTAVVVEVRLKIQDQPQTQTQSDMASKAPGRSAEISVNDNGYGILPKNLPRIFDPYTRFSSPAHLESTDVKQEQIGHGLGLRLVKTVVEVHQGTIRCESEPGRGSKFIIELPGA
jgi:CHASE2 domain-containing sensor protein/signal transduction histidine kinase